MRLIPLWEADEERAYDLQKSFAPNENGFVSGAYALSRQAFSKFVQLRNGARVDHESGEEYFTRIPLSRQP